MSSPPEALVRLRVPALDEILGQPFSVLDDGFVRVVDHMGTDEAVVQAARVSYGSGTKRVHEDRGLIRYLIRHAHTTPFEMCELKLHVRVPMDCWRQWIRHRTASVNEYSTRYSVAIDRAQLTPPDAWRRQRTSNKQGSSGTLAVSVGERLTEGEAKLQALAREVYEDRLTVGVAREQARKDLPLSTYTEAYWKIDLHNLLHFLRLRMAEEAQPEIRAYASTIGNEIVARWCPVVWEAFRDYAMESLALSRIERRILSAVIRGDREGSLQIARDAGWLVRAAGHLSRNREREEFESKLEEFGLTAPWADSRDRSVAANTEAGGGQP
jgi:thymidylate synthase (FAD)